VLLPNCEPVDDLPSLLLVVDSPNVNDQTKSWHRCLMNAMLLNAKRWNEMMTTFRANVFRDANFLARSWRSHHYGFHATKFIKR
jgi:hypothetical protein